MARARNMLIGIIVGIVVVGSLSYATGVTKLVLNSFGSSTEYKTSNSATAPELTPGEWINSQPLKLKDLRGRVVLIEFWTFGCINCRNTLPFIESLHDRYRDQGLTVIGVHSPEFDEEKNVESLRGQVASLRIRYPVVTDNDYQTWKAYNVEAWPTVFLLDRQGRIRWKRVGEGNYDEAERLIQKLLAEKETYSVYCPADRRTPHGSNAARGRAHSVIRSWPRIGHSQANTTYRYVNANVETANAPRRLWMP